MTYTVTIELQTRHGLTQADLRARLMAALLRLEDAPAFQDPDVIVGARHLDVPSEHGTSTKDAIRERAARAARPAAAEWPAPATMPWGPAYGAPYNPERS